MAVGITVLTSGSSATDATSYNTASITPAADTVTLVRVYNVGTATVPTLSGNGLTYVQAATIDIGGGLIRSTVFHCSGAGSAGAITISFGADTQLRCSWVVLQVTTAETRSNGTFAFPQAVSASGASGQPSVTLGAFASPDNGVIGFFNRTENTTFTPGAGFAEVEDQVVEAHSTTFTQWRADNDTSVDCTSATSDFEWAGIALEIRAANLAPEVVASSADATGTCDATGVTVSVPAGTANGDLLLAHISGVRGTAGAVEITAPEGWSDTDRLGNQMKIVQTTAGSRSVESHVYWRIASSEPASYVWTGNGLATNGMTGKMYRITGHDLTNPINVSGTAGVDNDVLTLPSVVPSAADTLLLATGGVSRSAIVTWESPASMIEDCDFGVDPGQASSQCVDSNIMQMAVATGTKVLTPSNITSMVAAGVIFAVASVSASTSKPSGSLLAARL